MALAIKRSFNSQKIDYSSYNFSAIFSLFGSIFLHQIDNLINWHSMIDHRNVNVEFAKCINDKILCKLVKAGGFFNSKNGQKMLDLGRQILI